MGKRVTTVSVDDDLLKIAKEAQMNVSAVLEESIRKKLGGQETTIPKEDGEICQVCRKPYPKATRENLDGLTWLYPDDIWICPSCLDTEVRQVIVSESRVKPMTKEKKQELMELAREFVNQPEIRKDILTQAKNHISGAGQND